MAVDPLVGKVLADRFEILSRIGEGGTGVVYKAKQLAVDREIAIKVLGAHVSNDQNWRLRFQDEARISARLSHPNTVQVIDFGETRDGLYFIAMELLLGHSLREEIERNGKMAPVRALRIMIQACGSVAEAHANKIIHRDLKPDNIYLCEMKGAGDFVKVLDFSVAKTDDPGAVQTRAGVVFGTPAYMSPEQGRGAKLGPQSDIYAFGIVLYELLSGKPPFESKIPTDVVMMHLRDRPPALTGVPENVVRVVMRALEKDPSRRYQSCAELAADCEAVLGELQPNVTPGGTPALGGAPPARGRASTGAQPPVAAGARGANPPPSAHGAAAGVINAGPAAPKRPVTAATPQARTVIADDAVAAPPPSSRGGAARPAGGPRTVLAADAPTSRPTAYDSPAAGHEGGTMILPDSSGVVAFAQQQIRDARAAAIADAVAVEVPERVPFAFWAAWAIVGAGIGLLIHLITRASGH